jgi:segregation and condensation protein B
MSLPDDELPGLGREAELDAAIEAVLMVVDAPVPATQLAEVLEQPAARVTTALERLAASYAGSPDASGSAPLRERGFELRRTDEGWRFASRARFAPYVERFVLDGQRARLTRAALETLAVVAYRQPVTRARVSAVRGVNVDGVMRTLTARGLIVEAGVDGATGGTLYRTTELFLERLGLGSLDELPPIAPLLPEVDDIDEL